MKERKPHYLRPNKSQKTPNHFIFVDTETKQIPVSDTETKHTLRLGWCVYYRAPFKEHRGKEEWYEFKEVSEFWNFVEAHTFARKRLILISHNIDFDFMILDGFNELKKRGYTLQSFYEKMGAKVFRFRKGEKRARKTIIVLDNVNFFPGKLEDIGNVVGVPKMHVNFKTVKDDELSVYCKNDVKILLELWKNYLPFLKEHNLGCFGMTSASQSFNAYRHRFMHKKIFIHNNEQALDLETKAYHGGRTEAFFIGKVPAKKIYYLDVNSMYPFVMKFFQYPKYILGYGENIPVSDLIKLLSQYFVIADVWVKTEQPAFPYYDGEKLFFPVGEFRTVLSESELVYALKYGKIEKVFRYAYYDTADLFSDYVNYFYKLKKEYKEQGNKVYYLFVKRFMNSLYGKFGQKTDCWETISKNDPRPTGIYEIWDSEKQCYHTERVIYGLAQREVERKVAFNAFPAIASAVTANARMYLWSLILKAGRKNVYYCDTDSLFVNERGFDNLSNYISSSDLGKLKVEKSSDYCVIYGPKDYEFGEEITMKGIRKDATLVGYNTFLQEEFPSIIGMIRNRKKDGYIVSKIKKHLYRDYNKGIIQSDGWVTPIRLPT